MIRVSINEKECLACGSCLSADHIIREKRDGKAEVIPGIYFESSDLPSLEKVVAMCPVDAISYKVVKLQALSDRRAKRMLDTFEKRLSAIVLPKPKYCDLVYVRDDYHIERPSLPIENKYYSSRKKAQNAAIEHFNRNLYKNHRAFLMDLATQYKVAKAHEYETYGPTSFFGRWNEIIGQELEKFYDELMIATYGCLPLPPSFMDFNPYVGLSSNRIEKSWITEAVETMATRAWKEIKDNSSYSLDSYKGYIEVHDYEKYDEGIFWDSTKTVYRVFDCYNLVDEFIGDLENAMSWISPQEDMERAIRLTLDSYSDEVNKCLTDKIKMVKEALLDYGIKSTFLGVTSYYLMRAPHTFVTVEK